MEKFLFAKRFTANNYRKWCLEGHLRILNFKNYSYGENTVFNICEVKVKNLISVLMLLLSFGTSQADCVVAVTGNYKRCTSSLGADDFPNFGKSLKIRSQRDGLYPIVKILAFRDEKFQRPYLPYSIIVNNSELPVHDPYGDSPNHTYVSKSYCNGNSLKQDIIRVENDYELSVAQHTSFTPIANNRLEVVVFVDIKHNDRIRPESSITAFICEK